MAISIRSGQVLPYGESTVLRRTDTEAIGRAMMATEDNVNPMAPSANYVQVTKVLEPIDFLPYTKEGEERAVLEVAADAPFAKEDEAKAIPQEETYQYQKKQSVADRVKVSGTSIALLLIALAYAGILLVGWGFGVDALAIFRHGNEAVHGITLMQAFLSTFTLEDNTMGLVQTLVLLAMALVAVGALVGIKQKGATLFTKLASFACCAGSIVFAILAFMQENTKVGGGIIALSVLGVLTAVIAFVVKRKAH